MGQLLDGATHLYWQVMEPPGLYRVLGVCILERVPKRIFKPQSQKGLGFFVLVGMVCLEPAMRSLEPMTRYLCRYSSPLGARRHTMECVDGLNLCHRGGIRMYIDTCLAIVLWVFAIFGFICFVVLALRDISTALGNKKGYFNVVITAQNQEDAIEGIVRGFILKTAVDGDSPVNIVLVDVGSCDDTPKVMERLARQYPYIKFLKPGELCGYLAKLIQGLK